jgi:hypothetical protein
MTTKTTKRAISRLLSKGLTGWEAGKLIIQDSIDSMCGKAGLLTDMDMSRIDQGLTANKDIKDYNRLMAANRNIDRCQMISRISSFEACLDISLISRILSDVEKKNTVDFLSSFLPRLVTEKQYQDICEEQRKIKLDFEFCLEYIAVERAALKATPDTEYVPDADNIKEQCPEVYWEALREIFKLYKEGKLETSYHEEDKDKVQDLLAKQKKGKLFDEELWQLLDKLNVTGQQLYECNELPEWKELIDNFQRHWHADKDGRFSYSYAVVQNPWYENVDEKGYYKSYVSPSEFIIKRNEVALGLRTVNGKKAKSCKMVSQDLQALLRRVKVNLRCFLAIKVIIDASSEAIGVKFPDKAGGVDGAHEQLKLYIEEYNHNLERLKEKKRWSDCKETKLEKVLKALFPIDIEQLMPSATSIKWLEENVVDTFRDEYWLRDRMLSLEYDDGFSFRNVYENN